MLKKEQKIVGVIPARGGSKGIKNKNMIELCGIPLIEYTIRAAKKSNFLSKFLVSSDSDEIIEYCRKANVSAPFKRPSNLSNDIAQSADVVLHAVSFLESNNEHYDAVMLLQPTNPMRTAEMIDSAIIKFRNERTEGIISLVDVEANHPQRMYTLNENFYMKPVIPSEDPMVPRQKLPKIFIRSGDIYLISIKELKLRKSLIAENSVGLVIPSSDTVNIDTYQDLKLAELRLIEK